MRRLKGWFMGATVGLATLAVLVAGSSIASAQEEAETPPDVSAPSDKASIDSGRQIVLNVCINCHSLRYIRNPETNRPYASRLDATAAQAAYGVVPPDLTMMARARPGGAPYIYALLTGYESDPGDCTTAGGRNKYFPPGCIAMPNPNLSEEQALDVAGYLAQVADPHKDLRIRTGIGVEIVTLLLTVLAYLVYRRVKKRYKH